MLGPGCLPSKPPISQIVSPTSTARAVGHHLRRVGEPLPAVGRGVVDVRARRGLGRVLAEAAEHPELPERGQAVALEALDRVLGPGLPGEADLLGGAQARARQPGGPAPRRRRRDVGLQRRLDDPGRSLRPAGVRAAVRRRRPAQREAGGARGDRGDRQTHVSTFHVPIPPWVVQWWPPAAIRSASAFTRRTAACEMRWLMCSCRAVSDSRSRLTGRSRRAPTGRSAAAQRRHPAQRGLRDALVDPELPKRELDPRPRGGPARPRPRPAGDRRAPARSPGGPPPARCAG